MLWMAASLAIAQGGLFSQVVPAPTGRNGFEEYVRAAERVDNAAFRQWQSQPLPDQTVLERSRWLLERYGSSVELLRQGNGKPVFEPRPRLDLAPRFPEYRSLRALSQAMTSAAYAEFAAGKTAEGTDRLLQTLRMGQNIAGIGTALAHSVGCVQSRATFDAFDARLNQLSREDCRKIDAEVTGLLERPPGTAKIFEDAGNWLRLAVDGIAANPKDAMELEAPLGQAIAGLSPTDIPKFRQAVERAIADRYEPLIRAFRGPESQWLFLPETPTAFRKGGDIEEMAQAFVNELGASYRGSAVAGAQTRTQLRLLRLHARIRMFRWEHDRWPVRLDDASSDVFDPLAEERFEYRPTENGYVLLSRGRPETGPVTLRSTNAPGISGKIDP